jgi:signal transduction histidine kinase
MPSDPKTSSPGRTQTDESLRAERDKVDLALDEKLAAIDQTADAVISLARARADAVLAAARAKTDRQPVVARTGRHASEIIARERLAADCALQEERSVADETLQDEREQHIAFLSSERKDTDENLEDERTQADDALASRDEFMALVSHDLRNMLSAVVGFAAHIERKAAEPGSAGEVEQYARRIQRAGGRMSRLIGDLVDVASIEAGKLTVTLEQGDAAHIASEAVDTLRAQAAAAGLSLVTELAPESPLPVCFDPPRILQVLVNLIGNAIKFTPATGTIVVRVGQIGSDVQFSIEDTGMGIATEDLERIFARSSQVKKNDARGSGLGLFISRCIVQGHGGRLWAESQLGRGSTFRFTLPRYGIA